MTAQLLQGDALDVLATLPTGSVQACVTSPPYYGLRDYGADGQIGLEDTPDEYLQRLVSIFREVRRVLADDGTLWLNLGDSYAAQGGPQVNGTKQARGSQEGAWGGKSRQPIGGLKPKDLIGIPWRVAFALQADGWYLRADIIWHKPNPMPESVRDRPTKAHEYLFLLSQSERYFYDYEAIREARIGDEDANGFRGGAYIEGRTFDNSQGGKRTRTWNVRRSDKQRGHGRRHAGFNDRWDAMSKAEQAEMGRNKRSVWTVATRPYPEAHFATYPPDLIRPCILAGTKPGDTVLDPFNGSGTTGQVALEHGRAYVGIDLNPEYLELARQRLAPLLAQPRLLEAV